MYPSKCVQGSSSGTGSPHFLLANDMQSKLQEGNNHIYWGKRQNRRRRSGNNLNIVVLPQNPLRQVTHHLLFIGHDPSGVPAHVLKRHHVSSALVRPPKYMRMLHQDSEVISISKPPFRFPSTHIRVSPFVIFIFLPRNDMSEVSYKPSLHTQRDKFISVHKYHTKK